MPVGGFPIGLGQSSSIPKDILKLQPRYCPQTLAASSAWFVSINTYLPIDRSIYRSILSVYLSIYLSLYLSIFLSF